MDPLFAMRSLIIQRGDSEWCMFETQLDLKRTGLTIMSRDPEMFSLILYRIDSSEPV